MTELLKKQNRKETVNFIKERIFEAFPSLKEEEQALTEMQFFFDFERFLRNIQGFNSICCVGTELAFWALPLFGFPRTIILNKQLGARYEGVAAFIRFGIRMDSSVHIVNYSPCSPEFFDYLVGFDSDLFILGGPYHYFGFPEGFYLPPERRGKFHVSYLEKYICKGKLLFWWFNCGFKRPMPI